MKCPNCSETLLITERHDIEIDYCPSCRGVWLDKGELDKMLDYAERRYSVAGLRPDNDTSFRYSDATHPQHTHKYRKKKSFLGELFDFD